MGMICIGAVYSDRMTPAQVREMMELAKIAIERNSVSSQSYHRSKMEHLVLKANPLDQAGPSSNRSQLFS